MTTGNPKAIFNWSGGKDSALALYRIQQEKKYDVLSLLTTVNEKFHRISMHGVREELLEQQAKSIGLPLKKVVLPEMPSMEIYEQQMEAVLKELKNEGATVSVFGDIFLEDLREYREKKLATLQLEGLFPLWKIPTDQLIREFLDLGFKTIVSCVNENNLDKSFAGRIIDENFLNDLPEDVDPCGENGEFHTFVFDGPIFSVPIVFEKGEVVYRKYSSSQKDDAGDETPFDYGFWYCDLLPG